MKQTKDRVYKLHIYHTQLETLTGSVIVALTAVLITLIGIVHCEVPAPARLANMCFTDDQLQEHTKYTLCITFAVLQFKLLFVCIESTNKIFTQYKYFASHIYNDIEHIT